MAPEGFKTMATLTEGIARQLEDVRGIYKLSPKTTEPYSLPEHCTQCGSPMVVKKGWTIFSFDNQTGQANRYEALVCCIKSSWWRMSSHDKRALIFIPRKFHLHLGSKKHHLSVMTLMTKGI